MINNFIWVQRYGDFRMSTIARLLHFAYQKYVTNIKVADRIDCLSATYVKMQV